jgi:hypothetical protein
VDRETFTFFQDITLTSGVKVRDFNDNANMGTRFLEMQDLYRFWRLVHLKVRVICASVVATNNSAISLAWYPVPNTNPTDITDCEMDHQVMFNPTALNASTYPVELVVPLSMTNASHRWLVTEAASPLEEDTAGAIGFVSKLTGDNTSNFHYEVRAVVEFKGSQDPAVTLARREKRNLERSVSMKYEDNKKKPTSSGDCHCGVCSGQ